jgi:PAS domain S-box-containing protein
MVIIGGGQRCLSLLKVIESKRFQDLDAEVVGVADINTEAVGFRYASEKSIYTTTDYRELFHIPDLDLIINLTGNPELCPKISRAKPENVSLLSYNAACLFEKLMQGVVLIDEQIDRREEEITIARSFLRALREATIVGVMVLDPNYRIVWVNDAALKPTGMTQEEALGRYCFQVSHQAISPCDSPDTPCPVKETLETGCSSHAIHEHFGQSEVPFYCNVSTYPLFNKEGEIVQVVEVFRDITDEMETRLDSRVRAIKDDLSRLVQEDKLISLGKLVASVAHELNNPIASIINFSKYVLSSLEEKKPSAKELNDFKKYLDLTVREAKRCGDVVGNLLSFSRQQSMEPRWVDLAGMLEHIIALTRHSMRLLHVELTTDLGQGPLEVWGDHNQLQQCLANLVFNGIEAMPDGGQLTIRAGLDQDKKAVWVEVADTGEGILPENIPHIFEPFFTTKKVGHGVGLGLSMVYGIISNHRGNIEVESDPGRGTLFRVTLPTVRTTAIG